MYEQGIQGRHVGMYVHGQTTYANTNKNTIEVVTKQAHTDRLETHATLQHALVQREIVPG